MASSEASTDITTSEEVDNWINCGKPAVSWELDKIKLDWREVGFEVGAADGPVWDWIVDSSEVGKTDPGVCFGRPGVGNQTEPTY